MSGVVTARHLVTHAITIVREFGVAAYLRCVRAVITRRRTTFLECIWSWSPRRAL